jgi:predicted permease
MRAISRLAAALRNLKHPQDAAADLDEELREHLAAAVEAGVAAGLSPEEAVRLARAEMGSAAAVRDWVRDVGWEFRIERTWQDICYAARSLIRAPGFTMVSLLVLAVAVGVNAAIIGMADAALRRPLPYPEADGLVRIDGLFTKLPLRTSDAGIELAYSMAVPELANARSFSGVGQYSTTGINLGIDHAERVRAAAVTPEFFTALDVPAALGRTFTNRDLLERGRLAVISFDLWTRRYQSDPLLIGRTITLNGHEYVVCGVMPPHVDFPDATDVWFPMGADSQVAAAVTVPAFIARLAPGTTSATARSEVLQLTSTGALTRQDAHSSTLRVTSLRQALVGDIRAILLLVTLAALLGLLVACVNTASLTLARLAARHREFAIRHALGASVPRILRQVLCESLLLTIAATALAVPMAGWTLNVLGRATSGHLRSLPTAILDIRVLAVLAVFALFTSAMFAILPIVVWLRRDTSLSQGAGSQSPGPTWRRLQSLLVVSEIAVATALTAGAATIVRTVSALVAVDVGVRSGCTVSAEFTLPRTHYPSSAVIRQYYQRLQDALRRIPGVEQVGATSQLPGSRTQIPLSVGMAVEGISQPPGDPANALRLSATPGYFQALGIDVLAGRAFADADRYNGPPVAMVSERYAAAFGMTPSQIVGRRINVGVGETHLATVIGVVRDIRMRGPESEWTPAFYVPFAQTAIHPTGYLVVKMGSMAQPILPAIRDAMARLDPTVPLYNVRTFEAVQDEYVETRRFAMMSVGAFAIAAFALAVLGLYGIISYMVQLRTREIGVRMALGAPEGTVKTQVIAAALRHAVAGFGLGILGAMVLWRVASVRVAGLGELRCTDVVVLAGAIFIVSIAAAWRPASRASRIDPLVALRLE